MNLVAVLLLASIGPLFDHEVLASDGLPTQEGSTVDAQANGDDVGETLFLTPLIEAGKLDEAKSLSKVGPIGADHEVLTYAGYITLNKQFNSNLFFWFAPSMSDPENAPVVMWLQGGPGTTSMMGFFNENGPYYLSDDGENAAFRELTWAQRYSMLYVDQPVGTGYSFTADEAGYARNQTDVGRDMLEFLQQFFTLFGELAQNEFYLTGESYAGKYVPTVGAALHENADSMRVKINFRGIAIGNGLTDPINMIGFSDVIYGFGLIDRNDADYMMRVSDEVTQLIRAGRTKEGLYVIDRLFFGIVYGKDTFFRNVTGYTYYYNYLTNTEPAGNRAYKIFLQKPDIRRALHVGDIPMSTERDIVAGHFAEDFLRSAVPQLTVVLENGYKVLIYSGPLDICVPTTQTENFLSLMAWSHADRWERAPQNLWRSPDGKELYGYKKTVENLNYVVVRNGGHELPYDQPKPMFDLITAFIDGTDPFSEGSASSV
uniref:Carboxypeptidase n=1 Tax=Amblyomma triste TaxID=251400 RepID=A0A023GNB6_AMBTT